MAGGKGHRAQSTGQGARGTEHGAGGNKQNEIIEE